MGKQARRGKLSWRNKKARHGKSPNKGH